MKLFSKGKRIGFRFYGKAVAGTLLVLAGGIAASCDDDSKVDGAPPSVAGAVTDSATGAALDSALIFHVTNNGNDLLTITDHQGHYRFGLRFDSSVYLFTKQGYSDRSYLLPEEAQRISDYEFKLDVELVPE